MAKKVIKLNENIMRGLVNEAVRIIMNEDTNNVYGAKCMRGYDDYDNPVFIVALTQNGRVTDAARKVAMNYDIAQTNPVEGTFTDTFNMTPGQMELLKKGAIVLDYDIKKISDLENLPNLSFSHKDDADIMANSEDTFDDEKFDTPYSDDEFEDEGLNESKLRRIVKESMRKVLNEGMSRDDIMNAIRVLARSQGAYGRLLDQIEEDESILDTLEAQNFNDIVDMIMWLED